MSPPRYRELKINALLARIFTDFFLNWSISVSIYMIFRLGLRPIVMSFKVKHLRLAIHRLLETLVGLSGVKLPCWPIRKAVPTQDRIRNNRPSNRIIIDLVKGRNALQFGMRVLCRSSSILTHPLNGLITIVLTFKKARTHEASEPKWENYTTIYVALNVNWFRHFYSRLYNFRS